MKKYLFFPALILQCLFTNAQDYDRVTIHMGEDLTSYYSFRFPTFQNASVVFKTGKSSVSKLNFNMLLCKMDFIDANGDTLEISNPNDVDHIQFDSCSFIYNKDYFEVVSTFDSVKLLVLRKVSFEAIKIGAMGTAAHGVSVDSYNALVTQIGLKQLQANEDLYAKKKTTYLLADKNGGMVVASRSAFLKIFDRDKKNIENFLKSNKINFNRQSDLERLFQFCARPKA